VRNPIDAIASIQRRPDPTLPTFAWGERWLEYTARALAQTAGLRRVLVFYSDYFQCPAAQVARLAALLDLPRDDARISRAVGLVEERLRHHSTSATELAALPGLPVATRGLYLALRAAHALGSGEEASELSGAVERVAVDLWGLHRDAAAASEEVLRSEERCAALHAELERVRDAADLRVAAFQTSLSWRGTAPLRALRRRARAATRRSNSTVDDGGSGRRRAVAVAREASEDAP
jgi:hypothetical protein